MNTYTKQYNDTTILKVLVGSKAHGLDTPQSDSDYRAVFVVPTQRILGLGGDVKNAQWIEGDVDNTSWEIGHFLRLATKCNPTILETFLSPVVEDSEEGKELRDLFPYIWNSQGVRDAFIGYGLNQRKKFLDGKDGRPAKFAAAYARSLYNAKELLETGTFTVRIGDLPFGKTVMRWKMGEYDVGEVVRICFNLEKEVKIAYEKNPNKQPDLEKVNEFLLRIRKKYFN